MAVKRALLSVFDKSGIVELGRFLASHQVEILSTGGTARELAAAGVPVIPISTWTGAQEILGGRVKTLHPKVFGGILYDRHSWEHRRDADLYSIGAIDHAASRSRKLLYESSFPWSCRNGLAAAELT